MSATVVNSLDRILKRIYSPWFGLTWRGMGLGERRKRQISEIGAVR